jgi:3-methylfumaryl-CoA hydratase
MWASSKVEFLAPIAVDAEIERCSTIASISEKEGSSGRLIFVDVEHTTRANGALVVQEMQTIVYREATSAKADPAPPSTYPDFSQWQFNRSIIPNETLLFRYSALTFNSHRIHYDLPYATDEEGYRGLVVHGPLIASLLLDLAGREFGQNALKAFNFRAQSPAFVNEPLHLVGNRTDETATLAALGHDGRTCMSADARL